ncbi:MAG: glycoside hydrolase family 65 protein [Oenococcus sp.]|uniref:glycoside hydrolase family 65 protein n=1 Tax=Oenococcus TaxID=46254 RepID=UPI0021E853F8|nr:glycoside hydrolase family 65 protein [Oenococcus kitaharae]MCV3296807.1 glycoside hydrolase family 65 protein [Oenococcus kitaharae]
MKRIFEIDPWKITSHILDKTDKRLQESITSLGNEYMGMRGMFEENYSADHLQGIYIGGVWFPDKTRVGWWKNGYPLYFGKAINALNFIKLRIFVDDRELDLAKIPFENFEISLDMKQGILTRSFCALGIKFDVERFVSVSIKELAALRWHFTAIDHQDHKVVIRSYIDADVSNEDSNYDEKFWQPLKTASQNNYSFVSAQTVPNNFGVPQFTVLAAQLVSGDFAATGHHADAKQVENDSEAIVSGQTKTFEKRIVVTTSRDYENEDTMLQANQAIFATQLAGQSFEELLAAHAKVWTDRWEKADVEISGDDEAQQAIRFNIFQLFSTYYGNDSRLNVGPKGFTGEKYGGATYWDTEAFIVPMYLAIADPKVVRNLLRYRYDQLAGAYHNAKEQGLKGALFPMVTFDGIESHNEWEITFEEIHRNGTIAFALYNYTRYTGDTSWVENEGSEVLIAIARFWADRVFYSPRKKVYMIHGVTGPNEYENNVNNNWYTNFIARWTLKYALQMLPQISSKYQEKNHVSPQEKEHWQDIVDHFYLPEADVGDKHIFVQNDTYLDKNLIPVAKLPKDGLPLNQHWSWDKILRSPYIKQADVLQGIYYFLDKFSDKEKRDNFNFYEPLTVHESSLSPSIHAIIAADIGLEDKAVEMYQRTSRLDLDNYNNDTVDGLHITSMSGSWLAIVQGFAGMRVSDQGRLSFKPFLPKLWHSYSFRINFRGRLLKISVDAHGAQIDRMLGEPIALSVNGQEREV